MGQERQVVKDKQVRVTNLGLVCDRLSWWEKLAGWMLQVWKSGRRGIEEGEWMGKWTVDGTDKFGLERRRKWACWQLKVPSHATRFFPRTQAP